MRNRSSGTKLRFVIEPPHCLQIQFKFNIDLEQGISQAFLQVHVCVFVFLITYCFENKRLLREYLVEQSQHVSWCCNQTLMTS